MAETLLFVLPRAGKVYGGLFRHYIFFASI